MSAWQQVLERVVDRPAVIPTEIAELRGALSNAGDLTGLAVDAALAAGWRNAAPVVRQQVLRDALEGFAPGAALVTALLASIDSSNYVSANAALHLLGYLDAPPLSEEQWRLIGRVTAQQRDSLLPDIDAAVLLCEHGPATAFATIALCAFRDGPEDAEDRQAAISALGRFVRPEVAQWLQELAKTGVLGVECIGSIAQWAMRVMSEIDDQAKAQMTAALVAAAGHEPRHENHLVDAWQRWGALDVLSRVAGEDALPLAAGTFLAAGQDLEPWFIDGVRQRVCDVCPAGGPVSRGAEAVVSWMIDKGTQPLTLPPIAPVAIRAHARSPRISRRALVLLEQSEIDASSVAEIVANRACVEQTLVKRRQLMGSFLVDQDTQEIELGAQWRPCSEIMTAAVREKLLAEEAAWFG